MDQNYSIGHESYYYKCIDDILFNKRNDGDRESVDPKNASKSQETDRETAKVGGWREKGQLIARMKKRIKDTVIVK